MCAAFALFLIWFTIFGVKSLVASRREKFLKWYKIEGKKLQEAREKKAEEARKQEEEKNKGETIKAKVRRNMFKALSVMTMGSMASVKEQSSESGNTPKKAMKQQASIGNISSIFPMIKEDSGPKLPKNNSSSSNLNLEIIKPTHVNSGPDPEVDNPIELSKKSSFPKQNNL